MNLDSFVGINLQPLLSSDVFLAGSAVVLSLSNQLPDFHLESERQRRTYQAAAEALASLNGVRLPLELQYQVLELLPSGKDLKPLADFFNRFAPSSDVDLFIIADSDRKSVV